MISVLVAVIDDLFQFAKKGFSGAVPYIQESPSQHNIPYQNNAKDTQSHSVVHTTNISPDYFNKSTNASSLDNDTFKIGYQYFIGSLDVYFYQDPILAFDGALQQLPYGTSVRLVSLSGRWAQIRLAGHLGWVFKDTLIEDANEVYPRFATKVLYDAYHPQTIKLRACIDDYFGGARAEYPLSGAEYIQYRLQQKRKVIDWGDIRMRIPGTWQRKLRGRSGIHIGITPKTDSIMEYSIDDIGYLALVEAVFPDASIHITQIGKRGCSQYIDEMLTQEQWKELRAVFIDIL